MTRHTARAFGLPLLGVALCLVGSFLDPAHAAWWSAVLAGMLVMLVLVAPLLQAGWHATRPAARSATPPSRAPSEAAAPSAAAPSPAAATPSAAATSSAAATAVPEVEAFPASAHAGASAWEHAPGPATSELAAAAPSTEELETWWTGTPDEQDAEAAGEAFDLDAAYNDLMRSYGYGTIELEPERAPQPGRSQPGRSRRREASSAARGGGRAAASPWGEPARRDAATPDTSPPVDTRDDKDSGAWVLFDQVLDRYTSLASEAQIRNQRQLWDPPERARERDAAATHTPDPPPPQTEDEERQALSRIWSIDV